MEEYGSDFESDDSGGVSQENQHSFLNEKKTDEYHTEDVENEVYSDDCSYR